MNLYGKPGADTDFDRREWDRPRRQEEPAPPPRRKMETEIVPPSSSRPNPHKQSGLEKFKDYDYYGAIEDFKKSLQIAPKDVATHFNLACAYSLTEDAPKAFLHLSQATEFGFRDFQKIKEHQALAFLRIQPEFESFEKSGFRFLPAAKHDEPKTDAPSDLLETAPNLLDQLKKLGNLREQGLLTEQEFEDQKRKLLQ
jgi:tetratricopeptide (TPR) repeat protein